MFGLRLLSTTLRQLSVQRRFTKRLSGFNSLSYLSRLKRVNLHSLELRLLYTDLFYCYKMLFGLADIQVTDLFEWTPHHNNRGLNSNYTRKAVLCESDPPS